jgi:hypothetical protein
VGNYVHSVFEAMQEELQYFLGDEDYGKLSEYFEANRERFEAERRKRSFVQINIS